MCPPPALKAGWWSNVSIPRVWHLPQAQGVEARSIASAAIFDACDSVVVVYILCIKFHSMYPCDHDFFGVQNFVSVSLWLFFIALGYNIVVVP